MAPTAPLPMLARAALYYAERLGWAVLPLHSAKAGVCTCGRPDCGNAGKHPRTKHGVDDATTDAAKISEWWRAWPDSNIGIATGARSGLVVVDIDPRNGGDDGIEELEGRRGKLPSTVEAQTGGGGRHLLFAYPHLPPGASLKSTKAPGVSGVDIKADGGYIVAAPSVHASGRPYSWEASSRPGEVELSRCPAWLSDLMQRAPRNARAKADSIPGEFYLAEAFRAAGWLIRRIDDRWAVRCPWDADHTSGSIGDSSTVLFAPTEGRRMGWFHCSHSHCADRTLPDVLEALPAEAKAAADAAFPPVPKVPPPAPTEWREALIYKKKTIAPLVANAIAILGNDEEWAGVLAWDAFAQRPITTRPPPWHAYDAPATVSAGPWGDVDTTRAQAWLSRRYGLDVSTKIVFEAMITVARKHEIHPVRDYLDSLKWDGKRRLDTWLATYLGVPQSPYSAAIGGWFLTSAVARAYRPGCKVDTLIVFEGKQGARKSSALAALFGQWFADTPLDLDSKDRFQTLAGKLCTELAELDSTNRASIERVKGFLSSGTDNYRPSYARMAVDVPRVGIFAGTTNAETWQRDETGGRRFWPVKVGKAGPVDLAALARDRDQLWAEAREMFQGGAHWWPETEEEIALCLAEQDDRLQRDAWADLIDPWLAGRVETTLSEVLGTVIGLERGRWGQSEQNRVQRCLRLLGWSRQRSSGPGRPWVYRPNSYAQDVP